MNIEDKINKAKSSKGGWTKESLAELGVPWPPPKGWRKKLIKGKFVKKKKKHKKEKLNSKDFYKSVEWRRLRYKALKLSNGKCELCGRSGKETVLNVDHIKPRHKYPKLELKLTNLQVLCGACNHGKGGVDETDWRDEETYERFLNAMHKD